MSAYEAGSIIGFRWWRAEDLTRTSETVYPPNLGELLEALLRDGPPREPVDIAVREVSPRAGRRP